MQQATGSGIESKSVHVADRHTPLLRNQWYVAAFAEEITRTPMRRTILDRDIVFYRGEDGKAVALQNRCPHRSFPLHKGALKGDRIVCPYHGMEFNSDGSCGLVPALNTAPKAIRLDAFPLEEDGPLIWVWMGEGEKPDHSRLIRQDWCTSSEWTHVKGYMYMEANYLGLHENLMDLTHFPFLHAKWNLGRPEHAAVPATIHQDGNVIRQVQMHVDVDLPPGIDPAKKMREPYNRQANHLVQTPAMHAAKQVTTDGSTPPKLDVQHIVHFMTPETQTSTHYMWAIARIDSIRSEDVSRQIHFIADSAFREDKEALEEIEAVYHRDRRPDFREKIIKTDEGGIRVLRMIARLAAEEQTGAVAIAAE